MSDMPKYMRHGLAMLNNLIAEAEQKASEQVPPAPAPQSERTDLSTEAKP